MSLSKTFEVRICCYFTDKLRKLGPESPLADKVPVI